MNDSKKIVSITMVKNECDIIEMFVRHNLKMLDEMYIIDHMSTDNTMNILLNLKNEGLPIHILKYNSYAYNQGMLLTNFQNKLRKEKKADFILFLDSDEFIFLNNRKEFEDSLIKEEETSYQMYELNYLVREGDEDKDLPLHEKITYRINQVGAFKSIINVAYHENEDIKATEGGHYIFYNRVSDLPLKGIGPHLAHFPYRSKAQMNSKILVGGLSYIIANNSAKHGLTGAHWFDLYRKIIDNGEMDEIEFALAYNDAINAGGFTYEPLPFDSELIYLDMANVNVLQNITNLGLNYIKHNNDYRNEKELVEFLNNLDKNNEKDSIIQAVRAIEKYIMKKGIVLFNMDHLEEIQ